MNALIALDKFDDVTLNQLHFFALEYLVVYVMQSENNRILTHVLQRLLKPRVFAVGWSGGQLGER